MTTEYEMVPFSSYFSRNRAIPRRIFTRLSLSAWSDYATACRNRYHGVYATSLRKTRVSLAARAFLLPPLVLYCGIAAIMLIDSTSPECAAGNIFLMDGASHFVIIFARATARNGAKLSAIGTKLEGESPAVDLFPRQDAKFIIRARSLPRDYFLIARQNRRGYTPFISLHPIPSREIEGSVLCAIFSDATEKLKNRPGYFEIL